MKGTICLAALALMLGLQSASRAAEQPLAIMDGAGWNYQPPYDRFSAPPPMGLRYMTPGVPYRFGMGTGGGPGYACGRCANANGGISPMCVDWALLPWVASWHFQSCQRGQAGQACCNNRCCPNGF